VSLAFVEDFNTVVLPPEGTLDRAYAVAQSAWPTLSLSLQDFEAFIVVHAMDLAELPDDRLADVFLACACCHKAPGALKCFHDQLFSVVALAARRFDDSPTFADEVYQHLCELLFVDGPNRPGRMVSYNGSGALAGFVTTAARRIALRMAASTARFQGEEALVAQFSRLQEQETAYLRREHQETFNRALALALRQLPRRERLILRMNLVERVSTTAIATMYKVSQPTVSRWIQRSAQTIFARVKELVCDELEIDTRELQSLLMLVRSQIEITISQGGASITTPSD
jgi:RNA polymerase sigma-70 factor, ECF subfamily